MLTPHHAPPLLRVPRYSTVNPMPLIQDEIEALFSEAAELAAQVLQANENREVPVVQFAEASELRREFDLDLPARGRGLDGLVELARKTLKYSVHTGHPRFMNQLFGGHDAAGILGEWITALSNTSMYTFEAAPVGTLFELALLEKLSEFIGFAGGEGVFAPGGSLANLMSVLAARGRAFPHVKEHGLQPADRPVMFTSAEAHYSIKRAGMVAALGTRGTVLVPTDEVGRLRPSELERLIVEAKEAGQTPFYVAATSGTTVASAFDPLEDIAEVAQRHGMWMHIDGSYCGSALLSKKHRGLLAGSERADSMTWNPHKMMGVPLASSALLLRESGRLEETLAMNADYLFHADSDKSLDLGDRSLQCGRRVDALKLWFSWQAVGVSGFEERIDSLFAQAERFRELLAEREGFRLIREQQGPNVCFRYLPRCSREATGEERLRCEHEATLRIRAKLAREGSFLINYAPLDGAETFRLVASNPSTTEEDLQALLDAISADE